MTPAHYNIYIYTFISHKDITEVVIMKPWSLVYMLEMVDNFTTLQISSLDRVCIWQGPLLLWIHLNSNMDK